MELNWSDFIINFDEIEDKELTKYWSELITPDMKVLLISSLGDLFLADDQDTVHWLSISEGIIEPVADSEKDFEEKLKDDEFLFEYFLPHLIHEMKETGQKLEEEEVYGFVNLPENEEDFSVDNLEKIHVLDYHEKCSHYFFD